MLYQHCINVVLQSESGYISIPHCSNIIPMPVHNILVKCCIQCLGQYCENIGLQYLCNVAPNHARQYFYNIAGILRKDVVSKCCVQCFGQYCENTGFQHLFNVASKHVKQYLNIIAGTLYTNVVQKHCCMVYHGYWHNIGYYIGPMMCCGYCRVIRQKYRDNI
jgi:hypothetical protein